MNTLIVLLFFVLVSGKVCACQQRTEQSRRSQSTPSSQVSEVNADAENYTFDELLKRNPKAVAGAKKRFSSTRDPARKLRIASILIAIGEQEAMYFNYLSAAAKKALENPIPWPTNDRVSLTTTELEVIKALWQVGSPATVEQVTTSLKVEQGGQQDSDSEVLKSLRELENKTYIRHTKTKSKDLYQPLVAIRESDTNYIQAYTLNSAFVNWCKQHSDKNCDQWYEEVVYPDPDPWYFLAAAGDPRAYDLLLDGLHSENEGIAIWAAQGLAKLQDPRAIIEIATVAKHEGYDANVSMAECLLYFPDPRAQSAAAEILDDKKVGDTRILDIARRHVEARGVRGLFPW
jgi:predicted transcriptional regulator